jgi:translocation and assembly module TamB
MLGLPISSAVRARYAAGEAQVHKLEVRTPGAEVKGHGRASAKALDLALDIHAQDLARLGRALKQAGLADLGSAGGSLRLEARARGPLNGFALEGSLVTHGVSVGTTRVSAVRGSVRIAGLPRRPEGAFDLRAAEIVAGETRLEKVRVFAHVDQKSRRVAGNLRAQVLGGEFHASLDGALAVDRKALALDTMGLGWPGAEFASERPVTIAWRDGVQVKDLALAGPAGRLAFDATQSRGGRIDARVRVGKLDLARLPAFLLPAGLGLAGLLDLDGSARGAAAQPEIEATASLVEGAFKEAHGIAARVEARVAAGRATATGTVDAGEAGRVELSAALPLGPFRVPRGERASPAVRAETLSARISAHEIDLPAVLRVAAPKLLERGAGGKVSLRADLGGKVGDPDLRAQVTGSGLRFEKLEGGAAQIDVRANAGAVKLDARADVEGVAGVKLAAAAPFDAARALLAPGDEVRRLLDAKAEVSLDEAVFDLGKLAALGFLPEDLRGRLSLAARIEGDRHAPRGSARIKLDRGAYLPLDGAGADLSVDAGEHSIEVQGTLSLPGAERVSLARASLGLSAGALFAGAAPLAAPLVFSLAAQDTSLESLLESLRGPPAAGESRTRFGGRADFSVEAEGTAETPVARVTFAARGLSADGAALGDATASLTYREGKAAAEAEVRGAAGGGMSALAELETKLSARGIDREAILSAPAGLSLRADRLDLRVLQPLVTSLTRLQGRLQAELRARGPLRELVPRGSARLEEVGFKHATAGEVKDLTVAAAVDGRRFKLSRLAGLFNRGQLEGEGAVDCSESPCKLNLDLSAGKVRIQQAGITRAIASLKVKSTGTLDGPRLEATLGLEDAHIEVPEIPTKRVQSLDPHPDVRVLGAVVEEEEPSSFVMRLTVRSPKPIAIRGRDIELDLHADRLVVERAEGELRLYGEMRGSPGGWFQLYGKEFSIDRAVVTMNGDPANPLLDVRARYINPQAKVAVSVAGPAQEPKVDFTSEPHMEKDQIVLFLATGRLQGRASDRGASAELSQPVLTAVGSFIAGTVREAIYAFAPLDLISVEGLDATAKSAQAAVAGISVKAGKYIGKLYVGGKVNLGASDENVAEAYVEWQATPEMSIEATFGDKHQAADFLYTIEK